MVCHLTSPKTSQMKINWLGMVTKLSKQVTVPLVTVINNIIMQSVLPILLKYLLNLADFLLWVAIFDSYTYML